MIAGLLALLSCQLVGEVIVRVAGAPIPGPVVGMLLLFAVLRLRKVGDDAAVARAGDRLLEHLQLFFVPAGVGIVAYLAAVRTDGITIVVALVGSWVLGLAAVGWSAQLLGRRSAGEMSAE